ncbi:MAG: heavy-metal-associated domain-containing protein [Desulfobacula sp.]|nr:heavy-metal-associated domain-containing protein [Desulfobacula sp.]MCK5349301.1 heavy-metal-associated domain-containing protein [Desulfobacula sp.]
MASQLITLNVDGMSCGHCSGMVQRTLEEIDGVSNVSVDLDGEKASFKADHQGVIDIAIKQINEAGYKASSNN